MKVQIKCVDKELALPVYETSGAVGFDFLSREEVTIESHEIAIIPGNVVVAIPDGYMLMVTVRSSTPRKKGLMIANAPGIIDQDYCGPEDEVGVQVYNFTDQPVTVHRGDRIAQGIFVRVDQAEFEEVDEMSSQTRGGFGSTG